MRVKIAEPGVQSRRCELCHRVNYFILESIARFPGTLWLRWITEHEAAEYEAAAVSDPSLSGMTLTDVLADMTDAR